MNDILPVDMAYWQAFDQAWWSVVASYGYQTIRTPIVEHTQLFIRGIGEVTDIVEKEMYSFEDKLNGEHLTLRPENTASVVRACVEHHLLYDGAKRLAYQGPMFRHERPQRGRYRQFHQAGAEALGWAGPDVDLEQLLLLARLWQRLGLRDVRLEINCLGQAPERLAHRTALIAYFEAHREQLDADASRRLYSNPLRILDTKNPEMQALVNAAPRLADCLGDESLQHFHGLQQGLTAAGVPFVVNPRLVRGLDYYNLTVFEWVTDALGAQGTLCGGGRYDTLVEMLGGKATPACGFAMGIERVIELMKVQSPIEVAPVCDVYIVHVGANAAIAAHIGEALRSEGMRTVVHCGGGSFKSQMKKADASGARWGVLLGEDEAAGGYVTLKTLRAAAGQELGQQQRIDLGALVEVLKGLR